MSVGIDKLASELQKVIEEKDKNKKTPYDTEAEVVRVDTEVVWVKIPGGVDETPVQKTVNAKVGDTVQVRVSGGRAFLVGNGTNPPTDDTVAHEASYQAQNAQVHAVNAEAAAADAQKSAESARIDASVAHQMAENATTSANEASKQAGIAYNAANNSLIQLGVVEDVVGALTWIGSHGTYQKTNDTTVVTAKFYFSVVGTPVVNPVGNPNSKGYYELIDEVYVLSEDTSVDSEKTYYTISANAVTPSGDPSASNLYELKDIDQAVSQYIATHLALDDGGLHVVNGSSRMDLSPTGGIDIWSNSKKIAHYGSDVQLGDPYGYHIDIQSGENSRLSFKNNELEIAYMSKDQLYIPRAVVVDSMQVGDETEGGAWRWVIDPEVRDLTLSWIGGVENG